MEDSKIIKLAAIGFVGLVVMPIMVGTTIKLIGCAANGINNLAYKGKIKKRFERWKYSRNQRTIL